MLAKIKNPVENGVLEIDPEKAVKMERKKKRKKKRKGKRNMMLLKWIQKP